MEGWKRGGFCSQRCVEREDITVLHSSESRGTVPTKSWKHDGGIASSRDNIQIDVISMERRVRGNSHARCGVGENPKIISKDYLSLFPGAFSSNRGEDFRIVLEEFIKIVEPTATLPAMPGGKWPYADCYVGTGWSVAYRVFDTQYWGKTVRDRDSGLILQMGTPQRRRRILLVASFATECAEKILFKSDSLQGDSASSGTKGQGTSTDAEGSPGANDRKGTTGINRGPASTNNINNDSCKDTQINQYLFDNHAQAARYKGPLNICPNVSAKYGTGGCNQPFVVEKSNVLSAGFKAGNGAKSRGIGWEEECAPTLTSGNSGSNRAPGVCIKNYEPNSVYDARGNGNGKTVNTLTGDHENRITDYTPVIIEQMAFAQNQRNEIRDLKGRAGAISANSGMKQQTYLMEKIVLDDQGGQLITVRTDGKSPTLRAETHGNIPCVLQTTVKDENVRQDREEGDSYICPEASEGSGTCYGISGLNSKAIMDDNPHASIYKECTLDQNSGSPACQQGDICVIDKVDTDTRDSTKDQKDCLCMANGQANAEILKNLSPCLSCDHEQGRYKFYDDTDCRRPEYSNRKHLRD